MTGGHVFFALRRAALRTPDEASSITMAEQRSEFRAAMEDIRAGSEDAVWQLIEVYGPHIQRVVRRKLNRRMRSKFDSLDFVQMVWASFFRNPSQMHSFEQPQDLVNYLVTLARHKVVEEYRRRMHTQKYNVARECSLEASDERGETVEGTQPTPSQIAIARERWDRIMQEQPERNRSIVQMRIRGVTFDEIGRRLGINERTARRIIRQLMQPQ